MTANINVNLNQSPYFDDFEDNKNFHQVLYKAALPVQARELTQEQSILRNQIKKFGDHVFQNGSKVTGGELVLNLEYEYVKLQAQYNNTDITASTFADKTIVGSTSGTKALVLNTSAIDSVTGDPNTVFVKYITGDSVTDSIQGIDITAGGTGYTTTPTVTITGGAGTGGVAVAVINDSGVIIGINVVNKGSGYTSAPSISIAGGGGSGATATATVSTASVFTAGERISATDLSISAMAASSSATGKGSAISIDIGVFYINGNFINVTAHTLILDKYTNIPSYKTGLAVSETVIGSGTDSTLLDNAQGAYNYAAPGADRLKYSLALAKKTLTSTDDTDFYELLRVNAGVKEIDVNIPVYSVLEETFARRTYDESGSYTVRAFTTQLKDHSSVATKFNVRLDPGKAFIEGHEHETIIATDVTLDRARSITNVNNFDRLMQYGNYVVVDAPTGYFDISEHVTVDLHNLSTPTLTNPATYVASKIGTARLRMTDYVSGTGPNQYINFYLYDIVMTSSTFVSVESLVVPVNAAVTPVVISALGQISSSGKVGGVFGGDTILYETADNSLVFKLPQDTIKTIRDDVGVIDTSYTAKRTFENVQFAGGRATISTAGATETFFGTGALSVSNKREYYTATCKVAGGGYAVGELIAFDGTNETVTVNGPTNQTITFDDDSGSTVFTADIIATINIDSKQEKIKSLSKSNVLNVTGPNTTALSSDSIAKSDVYKIHAVYDSGVAGTNAVLPTLTVANTAETLTPGETITGATSGATGIVVLGVGSTTSVTYVPVLGTFIAEPITGGISNFTKTVSSVAAGDTDITSNYELDTGQRDNFYDHGSIKLKAGVTGLPVGRIAIVYDFFTHSGVGYLSADSYSAAVGFENIPTYLSPVTGTKVELRDCIDFRPRRTDGATTMENIELPKPNTNWSADYSYYLPRIDRIFLSKERKFGVNKGVASLNTVPPQRLDGTMDLYTVYIPAYTFKSSDVTTEYIENKRYTMRDIGRLEKRINNLEYYTTLSLLEKEAEELVIKDAAGLDRFKNGILVDGYNGHSIGNVFSADYKCAIDFDEKTLRSPFTSNLTDVIYDAGSSTGVQKTGDLITLPYTATAFVTQTVASKSININPFAVLAWIGTVDLTPPNDNWIDTTTRPEVVVNINGENDGWENLVGLGFGTQWGDWQTFGTGRERVIRTATRVIGGRRVEADETVTQEVQQSRTGIRTEITGVDTVRTNIGERIVDVSVIPFIRARDVVISVTGMKPSTRVYPFFDGTDVAAYCTPTGGSLGDAVYTDSSGSITGLTFSIPNSDTLRFRTGERQFLLVDNTTADLVSAGTYGEVVYQAQGLLQSKENVVVSTRVPTVRSLGMGSATDFRTNTNTFARTRTVGWIDPLAQTFLVDSVVYPDGIFLSDLDLYFKSKDSDNLPVTVQIRSTLNGYPDKTIIPFSEVNKLPADVNVSDDASTATKFTFPSLVYLPPGEYAIVAISNSLKYEAYISEMGDNILGTTRKVSEQPYAGVLFKSQNASTWSANQNQDLTFQLNRAVFTTGATANAVFKDGTSAADVKADVIQIVPEEVRINKTSIFWGVKMSDEGTGVLDTTYSEIIQNTNYKLSTQKKITTSAGSYVTRASLASDSTHISPVIDTKRNSVITVENIINNVTTDETNAEGGDATARYITRRVNLKDGFDATDLSVFMTANRQAGTGISVYYKVLSQYDENTFGSRPWVLMSETTNTNTVSASDDDNQYLELEFNPSTANTQYVAGGTYPDFKTFAIKVVMTSASTTKIPLIKDLRVIALA
jgi:hypothetical protein